MSPAGLQSLCSHYRWLTHTGRTVSPAGLKQPGAPAHRRAARGGLEGQHGVGRRAAWGRTRRAAWGRTMFAGHDHVKAVGPARRGPCEPPLGGMASPGSGGMASPGSGLRRNGFAGVRMASPGSGLVSDVRFGYVAESSTTGRDGHAPSAANTVPRCDLPRHYTR